MANEKPDTRLDRIARDLSRTWLHGSRSNASGPYRPATVMTGQQIPVDIPVAGDLSFEFQAPGAAAETVLVSHTDASYYLGFMTSATDQHKNAYLTLAEDRNVPTWTFAQRQFSQPHPQPPQDCIEFDLGGQHTSVAKLPVAAVQECGSVAARSFVTLWKRSTSTDAVTVPRASWQPALLLRMPLLPVTTPVVLPAGMSAFTLGGIPQSDRFLLDQLGLLASVLPGTASADPPGVSQIVLHLEHADKSRVHLSDWTVVRTNLTREARSQPQLAAAEMGSPQETLPYVATYGQDRDALCLIQMGSISNSGGYFLTATADKTGVESLVITILLQAVADTSEEPESAWLPMASNAVAWTGAISPDSIRFNGLEHIQVQPATPPGVVSFGWTRTEPAAGQSLSDEQKYGFGTVSLVEYEVSDGASIVLQPMESCIAISPSDKIEGDSFGHDPGNGPAVASAAMKAPPSNVAAMRMLAPHHVASRRASSLQAVAPTPSSKVNHFHGTFDCRPDGTAEPNRYWRIGNPAKRQISVAAGFRDVFGNRITAASAPVIQRKLFYTDALIAPSEWPGFQFPLYSLMQGGKACLALECVYHFLAPRQNQEPSDTSTGGRSPQDEQWRKQARLRALDDLYAQLQGVNKDVAVSLVAHPLRKQDVDIDMPTLLQLVQDRKTAESKNTDPNADPIVKTLLTFECDGDIASIMAFNPELRVRRTNPDYCPAQSDLGSTGTLADTISSQVTGASSLVQLHVGPFDPHASASGLDRDFLEIAGRFQSVVSTPLKVKVAFLRDQFNAHRLYLIPNAVLPKAPTGYEPWSMATPRPLDTKLGSDSFQLPDFGTLDANGWNGYKVTDSKQLFLDQDLDLLARSAFNLIERVSTDLSVVGITANADRAVALFKVRDALAATLSTFAANGNGSYLVPLFADATEADFDGNALRRTALDGFRADLRGFYSLGTCLQLPLQDARVDASIRTLEGSVDLIPRDGEKTTLVASVSDLLLHGGQSKATVLYSLPPAAAGDAGLVKSIATLRATFKHLQLNETGSAPDDDENVFNQGPWLELVDPLVLDWAGPAEVVPVAKRTFPQKPTLQFNGVLTPWKNAATGEVNPPPKIDKAGVPSLIRWGWSILFAMSSDGSDRDTIHAQIQYNVPSSKSPTSALQATGPVVWKPETSLQALIVLKSLLDHWPKLDGKSRMDCLNDLGSSLADKLAPRVGLMEAVPSPATLSDYFLLSADANAEVDPGLGKGVSVMKGETTSKWTANGDFKDCAWVTSLADAKNAAFLTGTGRVYNYCVTLLLRRNETFGSSKRNANSLLIYECVPVSSPVEVWASNRWVKPIEFDPAGQQLQDALKSFFQALLLDSPNEVKVEVASSLAWSKGGLTGATPISILPSDFKAQSDLAGSVAKAVYESCRIELGKAPERPKEVDKASLRLKIKVSEPDAVQPAIIRTLVEISQIDFPLA